MTVIAATVIVSLSIHVVMLQVLWVPYPDASGVGRWGLLYPLAQSLGLVALAGVAQANAQRVAVIQPIQPLLHRTVAPPAAGKQRLEQFG